MAILFCLKTNQKYNIRTGSELLQAYKVNSNLPLKFGCCQGSCGVCAIKVQAGQKNLSPLTKKETQTLQTKGLNVSYRLACQCTIEGDVTLDS